MVAPRRGHQHRDSVALRLEDGLGDVAEVLAVRLQRQRLVAPDADHVGVVRGQDARQPREPAAGRDAHRQAQRARPAEALGRDQVEPELEARLGREPECARARVGEHRVVRDEQQPGPPKPLDLEPRLVPAEQPTRDHPRVREVAAPPAVLEPLPRLQLADGFRVDADPRPEGEPPAVDAADRDPPLAKGLRRIVRDAQCTREHVRVPSGHHPEQLVGRQAVQDLVDEPVAAVGEHRVARRFSGQLGRVAPAFGEQGLDHLQAPLEVAHPLLRDAAGEWIDDERDAHVESLTRSGPGQAGRTVIVTFVRSEHS